MVDFRIYFCRVQDIICFFIFGEVLYLFYSCNFFVRVDSLGVGVLDGGYGEIDEEKYFFLLQVRRGELLVFQFCRLVDYFCCDMLSQVVWVIVCLLFIFRVSYRLFQVFWLGFGIWVSMRVSLEVGGLVWGDGRVFLGRVFLRVLYFYLLNWKCWCVRKFNVYFRFENRKRQRKQIRFKWCRLLSFGEQQGRGCKGFIVLIVVGGILGSLRE